MLDSRNNSFGNNLLSAVAACVEYVLGQDWHERGTALLLLDTAAVLASLLVACGACLYGSYAVDLFATDPNLGLILIFADLTTALLVELGIVGLHCFVALYIYSNSTK